MPSQPTFITSQDSWDEEEAAVMIEAEDALEAVDKRSLSDLKVIFCVQDMEWLLVEWPEMDCC